MFCGSFEFGCEASRGGSLRYILLVYIFADIKSYEFLTLRSDHLKKIYDLIVFFVLFSFKGDKKSGNHTGETNPGLLYKIFKNIYAPSLLKFPMRILVVIIFFGWACSSIAVVPKIDVGLDQQLSMPEDSFVLNYFK